MRMKVSLLKYIEKSCKKRGCKFCAKRASVTLFGKLKLFDVSVQKGNFVIDAKQVVVQFSIWKSIFNRKRIGIASLKDIILNSKHLSDSPFEVNNLLLYFTFDKVYKLLQVRINSSSSFFIQYSKKDESASIYIESENLSCNNVLVFLKKHLQSSILKESFSNDQFSFRAELKMMNDLLLHVPLFNIEFQYKKIVLYDKKDSLNKKIIDANFLFDVLNNKSGSPYQHVQLCNIPQTCIDAIICAEDPDFWNHHGISPLFIGNAIRINLLNKKILRGASTITMQLVKNIFLTHSRTILRKLEETIISLLLENIYKIDKETILELYLNIIEFAPNVYGVTQGSLYYFGKSVEKLSLIEVLTLTYVIPRPIFFEEALLLQSDQLRRNLYRHINNLSEILFYKGQINSSSILKENNYSIHFAKPFKTFKLHE